MKRYLFILLLLILPRAVFGQSNFRIDKLDRTNIGQASKEVGFSALVEGTVSDLNTAVYVMVKGQNDKGWRLFTGVVDQNPEARGRYRWRAICLFGDLKGKGIGVTSQIQAVVLDKQTIINGIPAQAITDAPKTEIIWLKRTR